LTRLPQVHAAKLIRALKRAGFVEHEQRGSHMTLKHPLTENRTTVPVHGGDVRRGLMKAILKQAGLTEDEFRELL
jgi:predicted RNA binding protein YcfA (HicA-like mRNA interferase family)